MLPGLPVDYGAGHAGDDSAGGKGHVASGRASGLTDARLPTGVERQISRTGCWPGIVVTTLCCVGAVPMLAAPEDVWVLWLRTPGGNYNILSAGPTREECMAVLYKLLPGGAPGESLRCLPKIVDPRERMDPRGPKGK